MKKDKEKRKRRYSELDLLIDSYLPSSSLGEISGKVGKRRTKKDRIRVEGSIPFHSKDLSISSVPLKDSVDLQVSASPEDWKKLEKLFYQRPERLAEDFFYSFIFYAVWEISDKKLPRGIHRYTKHIVEKIKIDAGYLYPFFQYWCKKPLEEWPDYLRNFVRMTETSGDGIFIQNRKGDYGAKELTIYSLERIHGGDAEKQGLKPFHDSESFYVRYIQADKRASKIKKEYFTHKFPNEIGNLAFELPRLKTIFQALNVI
jgi:hypothetical protein